MENITGKLTSAEFDRAVSKFAGSCYLGKPFAARREGLTVRNHIEKAIDIKRRRNIYTETIRGEIPYCAGLAVYRGCLQALAAGIKPVQAALSMLFPIEAVEKDIRPYMIAATNAAYETGILFSDVSVRRSEMDKPEISVSVTGERQDNVIHTQAISSKEDILNLSENAEEEICIVMIGSAAAEGSIILREAKAEYLEKKYSKQFLDTLDLKTKIYPRMAINKMAELAMYSIVPGEGGIFGALWELAEQLHLGMRVDLTKIRLEPVTTEICETFDLNPYEMLGGGAVIMATSKPEAAVAMCAEVGQNASIIGVLDKTNDRLIINGDEIRYLEPFRGDSYVKFSCEKQDKQ